MKNTLKIALTAAALLATPVHASTDVKVEATVSVTSVITVATTALDFGLLVIVPDGDGTISATLGPDASFTVDKTGDANIIQLGGPEPAVINLNVGAQVAANIQVEFPTSTTLTNQNTGLAFTVNALKIGPLNNGDFSGTTGSSAACNTAIENGEVCQFQTDAGGILDFPLGATITVDDPSSNYVDPSLDGAPTVYEGELALTARYY